MNSVLRYIRSCAVCQSFVPPIDWICPHCWNFLEKEYLSFKDVFRLEKHLPHLRLFDWHEENHLFIKRFIQSLKYGGPDFIFKRLSLECFSRFPYTRCWPKNEKLTFVPAPLRETKKEDHALALAKALAFYFNGELLPILKKKRNTSQKSKNRFERFQIQISSPENLKDRNVIFVDDVLTTGATAKGAYKALHFPKKFIICTLTWKRWTPPLNSHSLLNFKNQMQNFINKKRIQKKEI